MILAVAGCGRKEGSGQRDSEELRIGLPDAGSTLNPGKAQHSPGNVLRVLAYDSLIRRNPNGSFAPGLASSWRFLGSGNRQFELTLRQGVKFANGEVVDARSVKASLEYFLKNSPLASNIGKIDKVEATSGETVLLYLAEGNPILPFLLSDQVPAGSVISPQGLATPSALDTVPAGAGPYVLDPAGTVANDHYSFVPNRNYYDQSAIKYGKVTVRIIPDDTAMLQAAMTGQLDVAYGSLGTADAAEKAGLGLVRAPNSINAMFIEDLAGRLAPQLKDVRVRQAINYSIDRETITRALVRKYGRPTSALVTIDGWAEKYRNYYSFDPEKARALLAEAGYSNGFTLKVVTSVAQGVNGEQGAQAIARDLGKVGIKLDVKAATTDSEFVQEAFSGTTPVLHSEWSVTLMPISYTTLISPDAPMNTFHVKDGELESLAAQANVAADPTPYWQKMTERITEQAMVIPIFTSETILYTSSAVKNVEYSVNMLHPNPIKWTPQ
ncbi:MULTISPECIES: ABC transporter substrate-binding protein [Actinomycetes]|uniref:ABC transporter substrate-binding protein n=1 Tax=Actinomycetes TaxID=1760 RepID=UPI001319FB06|nr:MULTISPECIES: ABC transporter substrate-binding protein [Actinomycetes]